MKKFGFTLVETLVAVSILAIIGVGAYGIFARFLEVSGALRQKAVATALLSEQIETIRNLPYDDVGTDGGIPSGNIPQVQTFTREGIDFQVSTTIRNIDDTFDGTIGGTPNDSSPEDSKMVEVEVDCLLCSFFSPVSITTRVAPKGLEISSGNGALFIDVLDASGLPVQAADVTVINNSVSPNVNLTDVTNTDGQLQIIGVPPDAIGYEISVTKTGYSSDQTYGLSDLSGGSAPVKPHATVLEGEVTSISFAIDETSTIEANALFPHCLTWGTAMSVTGSKVLGTDPDVYKYQNDLSFNYFDWDQPGTTLSDMEWDTYTLSGDTLPSYYTVGGFVPSRTFDLQPNSTQDVQLVVLNNIPNNVIVQVLDQSGNHINDADVTIDDGSSSVTETSGTYLWGLTDWSGGAGQTAKYGEPDEYDSAVGILDDSPSGSLVLDLPTTSGSLTSSIFDSGSTTTEYVELRWGPGAASQPGAAGADAVRLQIASANSDSGPWTYLGPDGTAGTYYTADITDVFAGHTGDRYMRYRIYLQTADVAVTPNFDEIYFSTRSECTGPGQYAFQGFSDDTYTISASKTGYVTNSTELEITDDWTYVEIVLSTI